MKRSVLALGLLCLAGCGGVAETRPPEAAAPPPPAEQPAPPAEPLEPAPKGWASVSFLPGGDAGCAAAPAPIPSKMLEITAEPLKIGMIPTAIPHALANQLTEKTRIWHLESQGFDFYEALSGGRSNGLRTDRPAQACIRYSLSDDSASLASDVILSVTYDPKTPEVIRVAPARIHYRDFATLSAHGGSSRAAVKVALTLRTFSLERTAGRQSTSIQNQEMAVEIFADPRTGGALRQLYDPADTASTVALPPWDYSSAYENPRHNLSFLGVTVTEIADFDWLQSKILTLWPSYEYEATDVSKLLLAAEFYRRGHLPAK